MTQEVDMFCNMTGATLNEVQREALSKLLESVFDSGVRNCIFQCGHCGVEGPAQELRVCTLTYFDDKEDLYCKHCVAKSKEFKMKPGPAKDIREYEKGTYLNSRCDGRD